MFGAEILMALVLLLLCMGWYPCCCEESTDCLYCTTGTTPASVSVTFTGWAADYCDNVSWLNTTFTLPLLSGYTCQFGQAGYFACDVGDPATQLYGVVATITVVTGGNWGLRVVVTTDVLGSGFQTATFEWDSGGTSGFDCSATRTLTLVSDTGANNHDPSSATCQVN
jgi:hypothetical protein